MKGGWIAITPETRPKAGDEVWGPYQNEYRIYKTGKMLRNRVYEVYDDIEVSDIPALLKDGWTHFRPLNHPPVPPRQRICLWDYRKVYRRANTMEPE